MSLFSFKGTWPLGTTKLSLALGAECPHRGGLTGTLEGFSLPYMKEMATIQDLDHYKEVFAKWESPLRSLYCKPSSLAMFFG